MRAAVLRKGTIEVDEVPDPVPGEGQVLVRTRACGICGSDLHFRTQGHKMLILANQTMATTDVDLDQDIVMGHEFAAEVVAAGPETVAPPVGTAVVSMPAIITGMGPDGPEIRSIGYSNHHPGGYGEYMVLSAPLLLPVPNGLPLDHAALTEPMAVGLHAVNRSGIRAGESALVLGCGPVGLAVVAALRLAGVQPIVAADFSPARRALATLMGADVVVDPAATPAIEAWRAHAAALPVVIFEAVGVPGMLGAAMRDAPKGARILVVGVCMDQDTVEPLYGIGKELEIRFALAYDSTEFASTLDTIAEGGVDVTPLVTGHVGLDGVAGAFAALADPETHCKIMVSP